VAVGVMAGFNLVRVHRQCDEELMGAYFNAAWADGAARSTTEAIAYAQRGGGERKHPSSGWASRRA
jgi:hypothetical protein